jgi:glycosyltransferase involved in cell wall biosynthesis
VKTCTINDLPAPMGDRCGWPWTESSAPVPETAPNGKTWPKISLVTPSYNQGHYLEETIRSVLLQGYPNLEYRILDGGSKDNSVEIIRKYEPWLSGWVSERDGGQSDAINKGFEQSTGEVFNWICSDDLLCRDALQAVGGALVEGSGNDVVAGSCYCLFEASPEKNEIRPAEQDMFLTMPYFGCIWQPSCFFRARAVARPKLVRTDLHYCMDRELWCHLHARGTKWKWLPEALGVYRFTGDNKTVVGGGKIIAEIDRIYRAYGGDTIPLTYWLRKVWLPLARAQRSSPSAAVRHCCHFLSRAVGWNLRQAYSHDRVMALQKEFLWFDRGAQTLAPRKNGNPVSDSVGK